MNVWQDNRTNRLGRAAGNIVLRELPPAGQQVERLNGTTFTKDNLMLVCRVAGRGYLGSVDRHWCNLSRREHEARLETARRLGKSLVYLFITVRSAKSIELDYWPIPAEVIGRLLTELPVAASGQTPLHITERERVHRIGEHDVTEFHHTAALSRHDRMLIKRAQLGGGEQTRATARAPVRRRATPPEDAPMIVNVRHGAHCYIGVARLAVDGD
jgi:hypothetical protein